MRGADGRVGALSEAVCGIDRAADGDFHGLVGQSQAMRHVYAQVTRLALSSAPALIIGETGTGKELLARAIHERSARRNRPYVAVNCAALPRDLIESELFGYARGAFSGAVADHPGILRAAAGGTVLLDEITEMGPELQAKLLRVVQERRVRPVGAVAELPIDVRFLASTNRDPESLLRSGTLRPDLFYRLSVGMLPVPPLRERAEDIPHLVRHWLGVLNDRYADDCTEPRTIGLDALAALAANPWPGNVRELFNVVERAFIATATPQLECAVPTPTWAPLALADDAGDSSAGTTFAHGERLLLARALDQSGGNKARAARQLGISRKRLYARIAKYAL